MSWEAVKWAMDDAPMLRTEKGKPDSTSRHVLQVMAEHASPTGRNVHPSEARIMYRTGYERTTVQRAIRRLEQGGLIIDDGWVRGCRNWRLDMSLKRPASDYAEIEASVQQSRDRTAARVRRHRGAAPDDDVTDSECVTSHTRVTHSESAGNALKVRDVTHSDPPEPLVEPPENQNPRQPAGRSPSVPQGKAAAPPSRCSGGLPLDQTVDHLPTEDTPPVVGTATIPVRERARGWAEDLGNLEIRFDRAAGGGSSPEDVARLAEDLDLAKRRHMQGCGYCQRGPSMCDAGAAVTGLWARAGAVGPVAAAAPF